MLAFTYSLCDDRIREVCNSSETRTFSIITSYADMRSLATKSSVASSIAYRSRTFPEATLGSLPRISMLTIASEDILC